MPSDKKPLKDLATENPTQLGDPVSLKAETSGKSPTEKDRGASVDKSTTGKKSLKELAEKNVTMLGDPVSLKAEKKAGPDPVDHDNGPSSADTRRKRDSKL